MTDQSDTKSKLEQTIRVTKKTIAEELRRFAENFVYLAICLSVLETYRSLVLLQLGVNQFTHGYVVAITGAFILGKLATLSQRFKFFEIFDHKPLIWPVLFRSILLTICAAIFKVVEELIFDSAHSIPGIHQMILTATHYTGTFFVFFVLFTVRGLDKRLGPGTLSFEFFGYKPKKKAHKKSS